MYVQGYFILNNESRLKKLTGLYEVEKELHSEDLGSISTIYTESTYI